MENAGAYQLQVSYGGHAIGKDLAGAVTFESTRENQQAEATPVFRKLEDADLIERLNHREDFGLLTWDDKPRLSVAG